MRLTSAMQQLAKTTSSCATNTHGRARRMQKCRAMRRDVREDESGGCIGAGQEGGEGQGRAARHGRHFSGVSSSRRGHVISMIHHRHRLEEGPGREEEGTQKGC